MPGVIYGAKKDPVSITVNPVELLKELQTGYFMARIYDLQIDGAKERVLPRDVQFDPVTDRALHVDFLRVSADTRVTVDVPVEFINEEQSPGLERGGVLNIVRHEIEMVARADNLPDYIEVSLKGLEINDSAHISMVELPDGAVRLARSAACANQAFSWGDRVLALQFHLEMTPEGLAALADHCADELVPGRPWVQSRERMLGRPRRFAETNAAMAEVLERLLVVVERSTARDG